MGNLSRLKMIEEGFGAHIAGSKRTKRLVSEVVSLMPTKLTNYVIDHIWFASSFDDTWAFTFDGNDLKGNHLIFLSDDLLSQDKIQIFHTIVHEIGHVFLKHRNAIYEHMTKNQEKLQESQADEFARQLGF